MSKPDSYVCPGCNKLVRLGTDHRCTPGAPSLDNLVPVVDHAFEQTLGRVLGAAVGASVYAADRLHGHARCTCGCRRHDHLTSGSQTPAHCHTCDARGKSCTAYAPSN